MIPSLKYKVVLLGCPMVGKTAMLNKLLGSDLTAPYFPTIGTGCGTWSTSNGFEMCDLHIWDTAGHEKYRSLGRMFFHGADAGVLVIDQSQEFDPKIAEEWIQQFKEVTEKDAFIIIAANKTDLVSHHNRDIFEWASQQNVQIIPTSAKTGEGIPELFKFIALVLQNKRVVQTEAVHHKMELNTCTNTRKCC